MESGSPQWMQSLSVFIQYLQRSFFHDNPMNKFEWNSFNLFSLHVFEAISKTSVQFSVSIEISLSHRSAPV